MPSSYMIRHQTFPRNSFLYKKNYQRRISKKSILGCICHIFPEGIVGGFTIFFSFVDKTVPRRCAHVTSENYKISVEYWVQELKILSGKKQWWRMNVGKTVEIKPSFLQ